MWGDLKKYARSKGLFHVGESETEVRSSLDTKNPAPSGGSDDSPARFAYFVFFYLSLAIPFIVLIVPMSWIQTDFSKSIIYCYLETIPNQLNRYEYLENGRIHLGDKYVLYMIFIIPLFFVTMFYSGYVSLFYWKRYREIWKNLDTKSAFIFLVSVPIVTYVLFFLEFHGPHPDRQSAMDSMFVLYRSELFMFLHAPGVVLIGLGWGFMPVAIQNIIRK